MNKDTLSKLRNRAIAMAEDPDQISGLSRTIAVITFCLGSETYCVESGFVKEVYPIKEFTSLPGVPAFILGLINVRGQILAVVDPKKFFSLPEKGLGELNKVIILHNENLEFGLLADFVEGSQFLTPEEILPVPSGITAIGEKYLKGVTRENLIVLNAETLLSGDGLIIDDK
jgi:purine-binding chemotaxis protein CheW